MQVSIIFEYTKASHSSTLSSKKAAIKKRIKLAFTKRVAVFIVALVFGFLCIWFSQLVLGVAILLVASVLFYILESLEHALKMDLNFTESDKLQEGLMQDLYYNDEQ